MIENVIFDFGGVIVDLDYDASVKAFKALGATNIEQVLDRYRQRDFFLDLELGTITPAEFVERLSAMCGRTVTHEQAAAALEAIVIAPAQPRRLEMLRRLRERYRLLLLSNTNPFILSMASGPRFAADGSHLTDYFDRIYASCDLHLAKPDAPIFEYMIADAGIVPQRSLFVDDSEHNVTAGRALGFQTYCPRPGEDWCAALDYLLR